MTTAKPDLLSLASRFALLPDAQRKAFLTKLDAAGIDFRVLPIAPRTDRTASVPASFAQTRLWLHARMIDEPAAYHITERLRLEGALDENALRLSCDALIARHEALRTTFTESADGVLQTVHAPSRCPWHASDVSTLPAAERQTRAAAIAQADEAQAFDLSLGPLMRAHLIRVDGTTHWLALTTHHIVSDGWSGDVVLGELASFYRAYAKSEAVSLAPLPIQYADFALWQRRWLDAGEREHQLEFWRTRLDANRDVLMLPGAAPRPAQRSARGARHRFVIDATLALQVKSLANAQRATPFAVLIAALNALLARASGETQIRIGVPAANRERGEVAGLVGFFVNTLTLATPVPATQPFAALVGATQRTLVDAQSHQDVPFEQVVEALGVVRSASHHPLFQVMAAYGARRRLPSLAGVRVTELPSGAPFAKFDLTLTFEERDDGSIDAFLIYALDLFDADAVERLAARYIELLTHATQAPATEVGDLRWLPHAERAQLDAWNNTAREDEAQFRPVHQRVADHAKARPDARGVADLNRSLTRGEVDALAARLARRLVAAGVNAEMRVGVALSRSVDLLVGLIAALKSGGAFVPLDPSHPRERLAQILDDAQITHVITEHANLVALPRSDRLRLWLIDDETQFDDTSATSVELPVVSPHQAAYVIYTSGSTGKPKGVVVDHGSFALHCAAIAERYGAGKKDVFLLFQSVNFDGAHEGWFSQYMSGAAVAITADTLWPPAQTCRMMEREGVTMTYVPPGCATQLAEWALAHGAPPSLRSLTVGGEATSREAFSLMRRAFPNARIVNGYGPTETVITPMLWMFNPTDDPAKFADSAYLPIGTLVGARSAHVLDARLNPLPVGVIGELYLGGEGVGVARGYLDRPALTAERFVPDPFGPPGARLYRTGDLVKRRADGVFDFIGRVDHQVKLRGLRIELGEIEAQLAAHDDVREAVAVINGTGAHAALVAYVELNAEARERKTRADAAALDAHLRHTLPDYMVPAHIIVLDALPRNANSKVDRAALPEPQRVARVYEAPAPGVETAVAQIFCEVLGVDRVGRGDHFFELGGHSLAAVRVVTRVAERLAHDVPVRTLFEAPTLAQYAQRVRASARSGALTDGNDTSDRNSANCMRPDANGVMPLSAAQLSLWFLWRSQPDSAAYNIPVALRLRGPLDVGALREAFAQAAARHPALRTRLLERSGELPGQRVMESVPCAMPLIDLSDEAELASAEAAAVALTDEDALTPFDLLDDSPFWRVRLLRLDEQDHVLSIVVHHIVSDGQSIDLWLDDVRTTYVAIQRGASPAAVRLQLPLHGELVLPVAAPRTRLSFWRDALADTPAQMLPAPPCGRSAAPSWSAGRVAFEISPALVQYARSMALERHATLPMLLHAALNVALYRATGAVDQPVGVLASTRELTGEGARRALGLFINAVVVRTRLTKTDTPAALLAHVRDAALAAYAHADTPFADVVAALRTPRTEAGNPLFSVMFNYLRPAGTAQRDWAGLTLDDFNDVRHRVVFELELDVVEHHDGRVTAAFSYANELVDAEFVETLSVDYLHIVQQFVDMPHERLGASPAPFAVDAQRAAADAKTTAGSNHEAVNNAGALERVWSGLFEGNTPAQHDDLFEAGASSFDVVRFVDAAQAAGYALSIADVFAAPTFAQLGARIAARESAVTGLRDAG
ncbi:non-ribosomal peptide synthetase [Paraburkholderia rhynchosiae]|uniref:Non-ribosomal peptide synthetase n=1 Tax=Paraburkholderia rhynchosiae TaxID=487049 RepID=A0A2N7WBV9_9BURK|nr:non-ribosomal peptide synthetase [Paraburkholderia rhynchosiae]PMS26888.1 non-ribosomal peptide synthetase [Paraburkholderia rhynchosiae]CAB3726567.1 Tyrocidine synthase 3 [Paraburkholderia rhynchosiae]